MPDMIRDMNGKTMRYGVGMLFVNEHSEVLVARRAGTASWQWPQGGREAGSESAQDDAAREMLEELGITADEVTFLMALPRMTEYEVPCDMRQRGFDAQRHTWLIYRYLPRELPDLSRATDKEFDAVAWRPIGWVLNDVVAFKLPMCREVIDMWAREGFPLLGS